MIYIIKFMQQERDRHYNRYSGNKMVKHIALLAPRQRKSGNILYQKYKEGSLNKSYNPQLPRNISESGTALKNLPRTLDIYSQRLSLNRKKMQKLEQEKVNISRFRLPTISKGKSKNKNKQIQISSRLQMNNISSQIQQHLKPKSKLQKYSLHNDKKHIQYQFIVQTKAGLNGKHIKVNQDIDIVDQKLPHGLKLFCVCDGHGTNGHLVASFIKRKLIENLRKDLKHIQADFIQQQIYLVLQKTNLQLLDSDINTQLSGSTVVAIFIHEDRIYSFNVGDSRAIMINYQDKSWRSTALSNDHKPEKQSQAKRIKAHGGRIAPQTNERGEQVGPLRVWMKDVRSPGLAMTRSFGDKAGIKAGTTGDPQVLEFMLKSQNKYMLIASDGVWQHFQNYQIVKMLAPLLHQSKMQEAGNLLMQKCVEIWAQNYISRDDITFIMIKLNPVVQQQE